MDSGGGLSRDGKSDPEIVMNTGFSDEEHELEGLRMTL